MAFVNATETPKVLWEHPDPESTQMYKFKKMIEKKHGLNLPTYHDLYAYSITHRPQFWQDCWESFPIIHEGSYTTVVDPTATLPTLPHWFRGTGLNFAENILYTPSPTSRSTRTTRLKEPDKPAVIEIREGRSSRRAYTWHQLRSRSSLFARALRAHGVRKGDRVAVVASNGFDTLCVFLGTTTLGALFSSSSADMGVKGILDRLRQIKPVWVFVDEGAVYHGRRIDLAEKIGEVVEGMAGVGGWRGCVVLPRFGGEEGGRRGWEGVEGVRGLEGFLEGAEGLEEVGFERVGWQEGFLIVYSSGTTGQPKCIVHGVGGVVLGAFKEGGLHREVDAGSVTLQFTTTGWIMYLASVTSLLFGATVIMYDGSPFVPKVDTFLQVAGQEKATHLGVSPRYLSTLQAGGVIPRNIPGLSSLKVVTSTGMVLPPSLFKWFYSNQGFHPHTHLSNISGGTDIAGAFGDCTPLLPVYETGGCQAKSLGIDIRIYDSTIEAKDREAVDGKEVDDGIPGELVAAKPFPNIPICFYGDTTGSKYYSAYFARFKDVWTHGDFIFSDPITKALIFLGRADGVLNPSGVRFGSAEIYSVIENQFGDIVEDSICIGQRRPSDEDETVMLFLKMREGKRFEEKLVREIKAAIGKGLSPRHVPKWVFETPEIPTTINLKKVELPVKQIVSGQIIKPSGTLANPESLKYYYQFAKVEDLVASRKTGKSKL